MRQFLADVVEFIFAVAIVLPIICFWYVVYYFKVKRGTKYRTKRRLLGLPPITSIEEWMNLPAEEQ